MLKEHFKIKFKVRSAHVLSALFLIYIFYVGFAALPQFLINTAKTMQGEHSARGYIRMINEQYEDMLVTEDEYPLLQNKGSYINLNGFMAKKLGQRELNQRVILKNGLLATISPVAPAPEDLQYAADNMIRFCRQQEQNGGKFLFVMTPSKISKYEDVLPVGYNDTDNETADQLLAMLEDAQVPVLDLRETLHNAGISWNDAFFTTDHHWTPQTGFLAFREITEKLTLMGAADAVDPFFTDESNYTFHTFEDTFLGSAGRRTGLYFAGIDDSIFIAPDFSTDISLAVPELDLELQGSYETVSYHQYSGLDLENPSPFNDNMYGLYGWGDTAITHWRNESAPVQERILMIGDSFGNVPFSLMSICYSSCDEMDMRHFKEDFAQYYQEYGPQTVVMLINPNNCVSEFTMETFLEGEK